MNRPKLAEAPPTLDAYGNPIIVVWQGAGAISRKPTQAIATHGAPGHVCREVFFWQKEFWGAGVHTGKHDCPDGGCH